LDHIDISHSLVADLSVLSADHLRAQLLNQRPLN
jgi:hypothetical protein